MRKNILAPLLVLVFSTVHANPMTGEGKQESIRMLLLLEATVAPCNDAELNQPGVYAICGNTRMKALQYKDAWLKKSSLVYDKLKVTADWQTGGEIKYRGLFTRSYIGNGRAYITYYRPVGDGGQITIVQIQKK